MGFRPAQPGPSSLSGAATLMVLLEAESQGFRQIRSQLVERGGLRVRARYPGYDADVEPGLLVVLDVGSERGDGMVSEVGAHRSLMSLHHERIVFDMVGFVEWPAPSNASMGVAIRPQEPAVVCDLGSRVPERAQSAPSAERISPNQ
jgi:hypothetical protein